MTDKINRVTLNIGEHGNSKGPQKGQPPVWINQVPINNLVGLNIKAKAGELTRVDISFYAEVNGQMFVNDEAFVFGGPEILDKVD